MAAPGSWAYIRGLTFLLKDLSADNSSLRHTCHSICFMSLLTQGKCQQCDVSCRNHLAFCLAKAGPRKAQQCRKRKSLSLGRDDPGCMYGQGDEGLKSSLVERNLGFWLRQVGSEPQQCALSAIPRGALGPALPAGKGRACPALPCAGAAAP